MTPGLFIFYFDNNRLKICRPKSFYENLVESNFISFLNLGGAINSGLLDGSVKETTRLWTSKYHFPEEKGYLMECMMIKNDNCFMIHGAN